MDGLYNMFENLEPGSAEKLKHFLKEAKYKYEVGMRDLVYQPGLSLIEFADGRLLRSLFKMGVFQSFSKYARKYFKHPHLIQLMEFPMLFLGAMPKDTPALYSLMNYAALEQGTRYPMSGMYIMIEPHAEAIYKTPITPKNHFFTSVAPPKLTRQWHLQAWRTCSCSCRWLLVLKISRHTETIFMKR